MNLFEYQGKKLWQEYGILIPRGQLIDKSSEAEKAALNIGGEVVLKSQILIGKRGKGGGIKFGNADDAEYLAKELFGKKVNGLKVEEVLIEEKLKIEKELYLSITLNQNERCFTLIFSEEGGMDIEEIAKKHQDKILKINLKSDQDWEQLKDKEVLNIAKKLYQIIQDKDAILVEINPLILTKEKKLIAADAKIIIDDNALYRQKEFNDQKREMSELEKKANENGLTYVELDGDIAVIGNGAGLTMATLDIVNYYGGKPANFLDIGGGATTELMEKAMEIVLMKKGIRAVFINIFGGITRCDEIARGLKNYKNKNNIDLPIIVRMIGTNEKEGKGILEEAGMKSVEGMEEGAKEIENLGTTNV